MRDYKFAIKDLEGLAMFEHREEFIHTMDVESINLAIEALEYRTPKKVLVNKTEYPDGKIFITYGCPTCRIFIPHKDRKYCSNCGQALDWSIGKENMLEWLPKPEEGE